MRSVYSTLAEHLPQPKRSGQSFIDVYIRGEGTSVVSGLSESCHPEIKMLAETVIKTLLDPNYGISINFYKPERRKFEERMIFKYAAKKLMEQNHIDVLILARVAHGKIDLQKFQMQLAKKLGIHKNEDNDDDDDDLDFLDDVLARQIHSFLEKRNFLFVSERYLDRMTLRRVGIPSDVRIGYYSKLVFVTATPMDFELNVLLKDTNATWDLVCAQVQEYTLSQWSTSGEGVIRETLFQFFDTKNIIECIANFPWFYYVPGWKQSWLANILVVECPLDVNTRFKLVDAMLNDLYELGLAFDESLIPENFKEVSSSVGDTLPNLEVLHCSDVELDKLFSLNGCPNLRTLTLGGNKNVEVLDVSGTQLNKFPIEDCTAVPHLRHMDIVGTKCLRAVDWKQIEWLPEEVNWNEFGGENSSVWPRQEVGDVLKDENKGRVYIAVGSDMIFKTLQSTSQLWGKHFSQFLECAGGSKRFPKYISNVLIHTEFLSLYDDRSIKRLSDLQVETMAELKECWIEKCYSMETIFCLQPSSLVKPQPVLGCLENLRISEVMNATNMCSFTGSLNRGSFGRLKHMHLEYCPRLLNVFTSGLCLESLEVVEIKFCARLQEVFSGKGYNVEGSFNKLHTLRLIELPALTSIIQDVVYMPALTKIKVKGCPKLGMLPLRYTTNNRASSSKHPIPLGVTSIVVSGEPEWWKRLQWADKNVKEHICFESWPLLKIPKRS
ncbi:hypothetical protein AQUCO_03900044v1 [Aquilegia coerulea]|uniref:Disease resistance protein At4g27190-like leucine-rich repeats domain-containing protein n=1 Tax=Aquilegia coerulea TaxID=218851 RepID=A0A2G5CRQ2_AQUCA|nr:hypothetical protein AQUCO_03900044v1 [Aquilegia coerulea]